MPLSFSQGRLIEPFCLMVTAMDEEQVRMDTSAATGGALEMLKGDAACSEMGQQAETTLLEMDDVELAYDSEAVEGRGKLQITSRRLVWQDATDESKNLDVEIPCITLHAISKDASSYPKPCLYCQISEDEDDDEDSTEVFLVPQDPECLSQLFEALSRAAMLNPDPPEPGEEEGDDDLIFDQSEMTADQMAVLEHLESVLHVSGFEEGASAGASDAQFEDAEEGDEEEEEEGGAEAGVNGHGNGNGTSAMDEGDEENN